MLLLAVPVLFAAAIGFARGGWPELRVYWWQLAVAALVIQIPLYAAPLGDLVPREVIGPAGTVITTALVLVMLLRNATGHLRLATLIVASGVALNLLVIVANGGFMPRDEARAPRAINHPASAMTNTVPESSDTRLAWLGDTLAQPGWLPQADLISPGDVLLSLGAAAWLLAASRRRPTTVAEELTAANIRWEPDTR